MASASASAPASRKRTFAETVDDASAVQRLEDLVDMARAASTAADATAAAAEKRAMDAAMAAAATSTGNIREAVQAAEAARVAEADAREARTTLDEAEECLGHALLTAAGSGNAAPLKRVRAADDIALTALISEEVGADSDSDSDSDSGAEAPVAPLAPAFTCTRAVYNDVCTELNKFDAARRSSDGDPESDRWIFFDDAAIRREDGHGQIDDRGLETCKAAFVGINLRKVRLVIGGGGQTWDSYAAPANDDAFVVVVDPSKDVRGFTAVATMLPLEPVTGAGRRRARFHTFDEGALLYALWNAGSVDVLCLCSSIYRDPLLESALAGAFTYLLFWAQAEAARVTITASDWAAEFLSANFAGMTGASTGFSVEPIDNKDRTVVCVAKTAVARDCPLTALACAGMCAGDAEEFRLDIRDMGAATEVVQVGTPTPGCAVKTYMRQESDAAPVVLTTKFAGVHPLTIVWSTKHLAAVSGVRGLDREASAEVAAATLGSDWSARILGATDDDQLSQVMTQAIGQFAPGSSRT